MRFRLITTTMMLAILLVPAVVLGAAGRAAQDIEVRLLEEKLNHERETSDLKIKALEDKLAAQEKLVQQIDDKSQKRIEDSKGYYNRLLAYYTGGFAAFLAVLGFLGFKTISNWIQIRIKDRIEEILTEDAVRKIISEKGEPAFNKLIEEIKEKASVELEKLKQARLEHEKLYDDFKREIDSGNLNIVSTKNKGTKERLDKYSTVVEAKPKEERTYYDWFVKGIDEFENGNYKEAIEDFVEASRIELTPDSLGNAAISFERNNQFDKAEDYYRRAVETNPNHANSLGSYALFLQKVREDYDKAEEYYKRAEEADPKHANNLGNYGVFLDDVRKDYDKAEGYYKRAEEADPKHANNLCNYAFFLQIVRKDYDKAEEYYKRAEEADPKHANNLCNYALFFESVQRDYDKAEGYYKRAIEADPKYANSIRNYALFLQKIRKDYDKAEEYYKRATEAGPKHAKSLFDYALFLQKIRKDYDKAEEYYKRAVEADPKYPNALGSYAVFLQKIRKDYDKATEYYKRAVETDPKHAINLGNYAVFLQKIRKDYDKAEEYYKLATYADQEDMNNIGNFAGFLLGRNSFDKGFKLLSKVIKEGLKDNDKDLLLECWFYKYAHVKEDDARNAALVEEKKLITSSVRSPGWDLSLNVERAIEDGHPEPELLRTLARVIADEEKAEALEKFQSWREA